MEKLRNIEASQRIKRIKVLIRKDIMQTTKEGIKHSETGIIEEMNQCKKKGERMSVEYILTCI